MQREKTDVWVGLPKELVVFCLILLHLPAEPYFAVADYLTSLPGLSSSSLTHSPASTETCREKREKQRRLGRSFQGTCRCLSEPAPPVRRTIFHCSWLSVHHRLCRPESIRPHVRSIHTILPCSDRLLCTCFRPSVLHPNLPRFALLLMRPASKRSRFFVGIVTSAVRVPAVSSIGLHAPPL